MSDSNTNILDYTYLLDTLKKYASPKSKLTILILSLL